MSFSNAQRTIVNNSENSSENTGSVHRYDNVITKDGITVYALMKLRKNKMLFSPTLTMMLSPKKNRKYFGHA